MKGVVRVLYPKDGEGRCVYIEYTMAMEAMIRGGDYGWS
jgi:hypothetical protein